MILDTSLLPYRLGLLFVLLGFLSCSDSNGTSSPGDGVDGGSMGTSPPTGLKDGNLPIEGIITNDNAFDGSVSADSSSGVSTTEVITDGIIGIGGNEATSGREGVSGSQSEGGLTAGVEEGDSEDSATRETGDTGNAESEWPQCSAEDTMPDNPSLTVREEAVGYTTSITNNGYVAMLIGPNRPACLTDQVAERALDDLNSGLKDVVEGLGFPAFPDWSNGHYLNWVILNSGIPGATLFGEGGHQGNRWGAMNFESTQQCPCTWDSYNQGAALHESIHAIQSEMWKFNNPGSGWFHEAHNCYLGTMREHVVFDRYTMGYGAAAVLQAPHVPIESMGLLTDDTIGGPADQGARGKNYVGGIYGSYRYGLEIFVLSLSLSMGRGFVNCLWTEAPENNQRSVFYVLESYAGKEGVANAVMTFGARSSLLDFEGWTETIRDTLKNNWQGSTSNWFYLFPTVDGDGWMTPSEKQLPHHQGRNIIPIKLNPGASEVQIELQPESVGSMGTPEMLQAQLTYRTLEDEPVYGETFTEGIGSISIPNSVRNDSVNLVIAVINPFNESINGEYGYNLNEHFNYRVRIISGGTLASTSVVPW